MTPNNRLKFFRRKATLTQRQLQWICGWGDGNSKISHLESGRNQLRVKEAKVIIKALEKEGVHVTLDEMFDVAKPPEIINEVCKCCGQPIGKKAS